MSLNCGCKNVINQVRVTLEKWLSGFKESRLRKSAANDSHRLKQYLAKYQLEFQQIKAAMMR
jgi:sigma54-dependent transcription regulator